MNSRKQEERNEKIIRGLMKLPPNRKCFNCNNLGPPCVCTNFWTFVCMTCSGIHREFTHRVKTVSMSKFTSEEVEALQNGGNQRAREIFLKDWDSQTERLPSNSNPEKVRQFIKDVYVDRKYARENNSGKPPKDKQKRNIEDETRRASSYHSYSQSPPYDYQYEERRYGKQAPSLSRKPGSDRGIYEKKGFGFTSPSHLSDEKSRVSDYSVSSEPFGSHPQSPTFQMDVGYSSPSSTEISRDISVNTSADIKGPPLQRSASVDNGLSSNLAKSSSDVKALTSSVSVNFDGLDLFSAPSVSQNAASIAAPIDLFQLPHSSSKSLADLFQPSNPNENTLPQSSLSLFTDQPKQEINEGWATFDKPQISEHSQAIDSFTPTTIQGHSRAIDSFAPTTIQGHSQAFDSFTPTTIQGHSQAIDSFPPITIQEKPDQYIFPTFQEPSSLSDPNQWDAHFGKVDEHLNALNPQSWNAFEDSSMSFSQQWSPEVGVQNPSSIDNQYHGFGIQEAHRLERTSTNPFDLPFDSDMDSGNMFSELSSLQNALPNGTTLTQPWFPEDPVAPFAPQGALGFMAPQVPNGQIQNVPSHTPVASSVGGNPFA